MKKSIYLAIFLFLLPSICIAECTDADKIKYDNLANKVKISYDVTIEENKDSIVADVNGKIIYAKNRVLNIYIENMSEDMVINMSNANNFDTEQFSYENSTNGKISTKIYDLNLASKNKVNTYTFNIATTNDNCQINNLKTLYLTTPKYNVYSSYVICDDLKDEFYYCNRYVTSDFDETTFFNKVNAYIEKKENQQNKKETKTKKHNYVIYGLISFGLLGGIILLILLIKRKKK